MAAETFIVTFRDQQASTGVRFIAKITFQHVFSLPHVSTHSHVHRPRTCTSMYVHTRAPCQLLAVNASTGRGRLRGITPTCDLGESITEFTLRMNNLLCFIISPISASEDDEWRGMLIELNIDLSVSAGAH